MRCVCDHTIKVAVVKWVYFPSPHPKKTYTEKWVDVLWRKLCQSWPINGPIGVVADQFDIL